jgi:hypothetical protein
MNENELLEIEQVTYRESMKDGLMEFLLGVVLIVIPGIMVESFLVPIFVVFYLFFLPQGIEVFKRKYNYPRTGYVKLREEQPPRLTLGVVAVVLLIFIGIITVLYSLSIGVVDRYFIWKWLPTLFGVIMWGPALKDKTGQNRYYLWSTLATVTGIAVSLAPFITAEVSLALYMLIWGISFMVLGIIRFILFIRHNPMIDAPESDSSE